VAGGQINPSPFNNSANRSRFLFWWEQILQGLRRLTRPKTFEVDVGMAHRCHPRFF
jgi:hypothetical protein